ncbi:hypothetical protein B7H18_05030 [Pseudomonas putida]|nr:hypothetical protein B7H18_05030 [Pseudomonas putida]
MLSMTPNLISAQHTAKAILINLSIYSEIKGKEISRFRISRDSLKRASNRKALRESFVADVIDHLAQLNWSCVDRGTMASNNELAFIQTPKIEAWPRLGVSRVLKLVRAKRPLDDVESAIDEEYEEHYPEQEDDILALED